MLLDKILICTGLHAPFLKKNCFALSLKQLRNGKRAACNHGVMDAHGRLLIAECDSSFLSA